MRPGIRRRRCPRRVRRPAAAASSSRRSSVSGPPPRPTLPISPTSTEPRQLVADVVRRHERLDILVNAAGVLDARAVPRDDARPMGSHPRGEQPWRGVPRPGVCPSLRVDVRRRPHHPVRLDRRAAVSSGLNNTAYSASKAAIIQAARCMALELAPHSITVNTISPGSTATEMLVERAGPRRRRVDHPRERGGMAAGDPAREGWPSRRTRPHSPSSWRATGHGTSRARTSPSTEARRSSDGSLSRAGSRRRRRSARHSRTRTGPMRETEPRNAISSGSAQRRIGTRSGGFRPLTLDVDPLGSARLDVLDRTLREGRPRSDGVRTDPVRSELERETLRQAPERVLGRRVVRHPARRGVQCVDRRDVHDRAAVTLTRSSGAPPAVHTRTHRSH